MACRSSNAAPASCRATSPRTALTSSRGRRIQVEARGGDPRSGRHEEELETWLEEGADLTQELSNAVLAAHRTASSSSSSKGADINARDPQGYAPVHTAARKRHPELIAALADLGADLNLPDGDGMTPLQHAVMRNHVPTIKMLLERGADIEKRGPQGYPALALAIAEPKYEAAKALLEAGADIDTAAGPEA